MGREDGLDERKKLFCEKFLLDFNATQAYIDAGYTAKTRDVAAAGAARLLGNVKVRAYLVALTEKVREHAVIDIAEVVLELRRILRTDLLDAVDSRGRLLPLKEWPIDLRRALASIEVTEVWGPDGAAQLGELKKVKLWPKTDAAQQLMRHLGAFAKDNEQVGKSFAELVAGSMEGDGDE